MTCSVDLETALEDVANLNGDADCDTFIDETLNMSKKNGSFGSEVT